MALPPFYCLADPDLLRSRAALLGFDFAVESVDAENAAAVFDRRAAGRALAGKAWARPGARASDAQRIIEAIARAVGDVRAGSAAAVVTNPINKKALYDAGFRHPGHTEFLGTLSAAWTGAAGQRR